MLRGAYGIGESLKDDSEIAPEDTIGSHRGFPDSLPDASGSAGDGDCLPTNGSSLLVEDGPVLLFRDAGGNCLLELRSDKDPWQLCGSPVLIGGASGSLGRIVGLAIPAVGVASASGAVVWPA